MSAIPLSETAAKRRIGDILLDHGFVTAEELADAALEQERTQQPLGQILVGRGSITRLELASALAEQWSDPAASITSMTRPSPALAPAPSAQDEAQYAARLQEAVADLARKVQSNGPLEGIDERVDELSRRIESTLARTQHIEAAVATLAESLDGVTTGVEEAFHALQTGTAGLVTDLARLEQAVGEIAARELPQADGDSLAALEELRANVSELTERTAGTMELKEQVDRLAGALDGLADPQRSVEDVSERVEHIAGELESLRTSAALDEIQTTLRDLESRSSSFVGLAERLDRIEAQPGDEGLRGDLEEQVRLLQDLRTVVGEVRDRPAGTPDVGDHLDRIEARLQDAAGSSTALETRIDGLADRLSERTDTDPRVDDALAHLAVLESRLEGNVSAVEHVKEAIARHDADAVADAVDGRLDEHAQALEAVRGEIAAVAATARPDEGSAARLDSLAARVDELAEESNERQALVTKVEELEARLRDGVVTPDSLTRSIEWAMSERDTPVVDERVTDLTVEVAELRAEIASHARRGDRPGEPDRLAEIEARIATLSDQPSEDERLIARLDELERARVGDLDTVNVLAVAIDRIRHDLTAAEQSADGEPSEMLEAVAAMAQRIAALESAPVAAPAPAREGSELVSELERFGLVLERVGLHLGEHDRALADLAPSRGIQERLQELAALVQGLAEAQQNAPTPDRGATLPVTGDVGALLQRVEQAETLSQNDSEKLMNRLERMASSIDWRLQRLESDKTDAE